MTLRFLVVLAVCAIAFSAFAEPAPAAPAATDAAQTDIAVPAHDIARGQTITADDIAAMSIPVLRMNDTLVREMSDAIGKETRRALRAGEPIRTSDLKRPTLIPKGSTVTMVFEATGMSLTATGRAMAEGGQGDVISVLNPTSYRKVDGVVVGPGMVRVGTPNISPPTNRVAATPQ